MKVNVSELSGIALDWAVECIELEYIIDRSPFIHPSSDWSQGGPLIEREMICLFYQLGYWDANINGKYLKDGDTPLIAAMRCYVASKLGEKVEVPDELMK